MSPPNGSTRTSILDTACNEDTRRLSQMMRQWGECLYQDKMLCMGKRGPPCLDYGTPNLQSATRTNNIVWKKTNESLLTIKGLVMNDIMEQDKVH